MEEKSILCDSSTLICLSNSALISCLDHLNRKLGIKFFIPREVLREAIDRPDQMKSHAWSSIKIKQMVRKGTIEVIESNDDVETLSSEIDNLANNSFFLGSEKITILHPGEIDVLALATYWQIKRVSIDERTSRVLFENHNLLREHLQKEFGTRINVNISNLNKLKSMLSGVTFMRSPELLYLAYRTSYFSVFKEDEKKAFEYALYALKFHGSSISYHEIEEILSHAFKTTQA